MTTPAQNAGRRRAITLRHRQYALFFQLLVRAELVLDCVRAGCRHKRVLAQRNVLRKRGSFIAGQLNYKPYLFAIIDQLDKFATLMVVFYFQARHIRPLLVGEAFRHSLPLALRQRRYYFLITDLQAKREKLSNTSYAWIIHLDTTTLRR